MTSGHFDAVVDLAEHPPVADVRRTLLLTLGSMGASTAATGVALLATGHQSPRRRAFARQFIAWGGINVAIAVVGGYREARRGGLTTDEVDERRKLHRLLLVNSGLDVGYMATGAAIMAGADRLGGRSERYSADAARGDGAGVVVQGALLLGLDTAFALRTRRALGGVASPVGVHLTRQRRSR